MADESHMAVLEKGVNVWNSWRAENPDVLPDLSNADLSNTDFCEANFSSVRFHKVKFYNAKLRNTNFSKADFNSREASFERGANFSAADLNRANFRNADLLDADFCGADLSRADLRLANLQGADFSDTDLRRASLNEADLYIAKLESADLYGADLSGANLHAASFSNAQLCNAQLDGGNLEEANFSNADLRNASLRRTQALETDFTSAILTGVCIEDWNIHNATRLDEVVCDYVYLKSDFSFELNKWLFQERRPHSGNFAAGEFTKLFQRALETVDLFFNEGIDWKAFFLSFQELRSQYDDLSIQAIEKKSGGAFVIRLEVPPEEDKAAIESHAKELYEMKLKLLETQYRAELHAKDREIEIYKQQSADMVEIVKLQASRPINPIAIAGSQSMGNRNIHMGSGNYNERIEGNYVQGNYINMSQDLTQAAQQIQNLLQQLQNQGVPVETARQQVANDMAKQAETNPAMMGKLELWGKAMANKASETTVSEAAKMVFTLALKAVGVPLP